MSYLLSWCWLDEEWGFQEGRGHVDGFQGWGFRKRCGPVGKGD